MQEVQQEEGGAPRRKVLWTSSFRENMRVLPVVPADEADIAKNFI